MKVKTIALLGAELWQNNVPIKLEMDRRYSKEAHHRLLQFSFAINLKTLEAYLIFFQDEAVNKLTIGVNVTTKTYKTFLILFAFYGFLDILENHYLRQ